MAPLLLLCCPRRLNWPPPDWRILAGDQPPRKPNSGQIPSPAGHFRPDLQEILEFLGGVNLLAILATVGILKRVAFEFVPGVGRGLNGYPEPNSCTLAILGILFSLASCRHRSRMQAINTLR